ncbi:MAG: histidine kinase [Chakrabartia sp.]
MWRYLVGGGALLIILAAGHFLIRGMNASAIAVPAVPATAAGQSPDDPLSDPPAADARSKEARRFDRYDGDRDGRIAAQEFLANRRKGFVKLDSNGDGQLSFTEYTLKAQAKFTAADRDHSGALDRREFATTKAVRKVRPATPCLAVAQSPREGEGDN